MIRLSLAILLSALVGQISAIPSLAPSVSSMPSISATPTVSSSLSATDDESSAPSAVPVSKPTSKPTTVVTTKPTRSGPKCDDDDKEDFRVLVFLELGGQPDLCPEPDSDLIIGSIVEILDEASGDSLDLRNFKFADMETKKSDLVMATPAPSVPSSAPSESFAPSVSFAPSASSAPTEDVEVTTRKASSSEPSSATSDVPSGAPSVATRRQLRFRDLQVTYAPSGAPSLSMEPTVGGDESMAPTEEEDMRAGDFSFSPTVASSESESPTAAPHNKGTKIHKVTPPPTPPPQGDGVCPLPPLTCPTGKSCEWGCLEATDCGDSTAATWAAMGVKMTEALVGLKLDCLGDPTQLKVTVIGPTRSEAPTAAPTVVPGSPTATPTAKPTKFKHKDMGFEIPIKTKVLITYFPGKGGEMIDNSPAEMTMIEEINIFYENFMMNTEYAHVFDGMKDQDLAAKWDAESRTLELKYKALVYLEDPGDATAYVLAHSLAGADLHQLISMLRQKVAELPEYEAHELRQYFTGIQSVTIANMGTSMQ